jgi:hypothetical protein
MMRVIVTPFIAGAGAAICCWLACGATVGLFFGGVAMLVALLPPLVARERRFFDATLAAGAVVDGIALIWLIASLTGFSFLQWLQAYVVLIAVGAALTGLQLALRLPAIVTMLYAAWLTSPIWLPSPLLAPAHPLLALNRIFIEHGVWTQQPLMYQLTTLGQDVPYVLPRTILPCVAAHLFIALASGWPAWWWARRAASRLLRWAASPAA